MNTATKTAFRLAILISLVSLAGCLSSEGDGSGGSFTDPGTPPGNQAPMISGNPPSGIRVGDSYSFTPTASDPDGDALTFNIQNKPSWADFNSANGHLAGVPTLGDIGTYVNIQISVSDGEASASMSGFAVEVTQVALGSTTLSWTAPTENEDGSALTNLAGYRIYYGRSSGSYSNTIRIDNPGTTTYVVDNLSPDTYFFAATAINSSGVESRFSGEAVKVLN